MERRTFIKLAAATAALPALGAIMKRDDAIFDELGIDELRRDSYYRGGLQRLLFGTKSVQS